MKRPNWLLALAVALAVLFFLSVAAAAAGRLVAPAILAHGEEVPLPAYRWVHPPADAATADKPAEGIAKTISLAASDPQSVATADGQCTVIFKERSVAPKTGESAVQVRIVPMDPALVGKAPQGKRFDSNAYRIEATYARSGASIVLGGPVNVFMRAATGGTDIVLRAGAAWKVVQSTSYPLSVMTIDTRSLGAFAVLAPGTPTHS